VGAWDSGGLGVTGDGVSMARSITSFLFLFLGILSREERGGGDRDREMERVVGGDDPE